MGAGTRCKRLEAVHDLYCEGPDSSFTQVEIEMTHCGLCHTDIHMRDNDWGITNYPLVAGHEGVGVVKKVGTACHNVKVRSRYFYECRVEAGKQYSKLSSLRDM